MPESTKILGFPKKSRQGCFGKYAVNGIKYQTEDGEVAWHVTSYPNQNPIHDFWIMNGEFRSMSIHYRYNQGAENRIEVYDLIEGIDPREKSAILEAIQKWEVED